MNLILSTQTRFEPQLSSGNTRLMSYHEYTTDNSQSKYISMMYKLDLNSIARSLWTVTKLGQLVHKSVDLLTSFGNVREQLSSV